jgi:hypothetical protein
MIGERGIFNRQVEKVEKVEKVLGRDRAFLPLFYFVDLFDSYVICQAADPHPSNFIL